MSSQQQKQGFRFIGLLVLILAMTVSFSWTFAQDVSRVLVPETAVSGTLNQDNPVEVYTFTGEAGQSVELDLTSEVDQAFALVVTDSTGLRLDADVSADSGEDGSTATASVELPADGVIYVTVVAPDGVTDEDVEFELTLAADEAVAPATFIEPGELLTVTGIQIALEWSSTANLDLEVRDPVGGSLRFATPSVASGGVFGVNVNSVCNTLSAASPTEQASWPAGVVPTGSYELLVYYQPLDDCPTNDPVEFGVNVTVDGATVPAFQGTLQPNQVYLASFIVNADGTVSGGLSGIKVDPPTATGLTLDTPILLIPDTTVSSFITSQQPYEVYSFSGLANDVVSVVMEASSGNLDTQLMMIDPNGNLVSINDDVAQGVTNSSITNLSLILAGDYTIIASRYGQAIGGTQGGYTLTLTGALTATDNAVATLPVLPDLPTGSVQVSLQWSTGADLRLLVRDPQGATVFVDQPQIPSGGQLAASNNVNCANISTSPVSYVYWPLGRLPNAGPYEIEVQYRNQCNDTTPVTFTLNVVANGVSVLSRTQQIFLDERYVTSYTIDTAGQIVAGDGGIFGTLTTPSAAAFDYSAQIETAQILTSDQSVNGSIRLNKKFDLYVFDGEAGQIATVGMQGRNGTLDTVLFLMDANGIQIGQNEDASADTTDSLISDFTLPEDGRYIIIATHFGGLYGVTAGDYTLTLRLN